VLVLSQTDPGAPVPGAVRDLSEFVMFGVARPVLLVPFGHASTRLDGKAVVAWNGSMEATRAVRDALPLLCQASQVLVAHFDTGEPSTFPAQTAELLPWLRRNGVNAELHEHRAGADAGAALLAFAAQEQASLIVMGGFGHSRFRELMLGGATRTALERMATPVLISH
jgi:nucleotide-binding universal stress UspA family protein